MSTLEENISAGRSLWIELQPSDRSRQEWDLPRDAHCTLVYLGKHTKEDPERVTLLANQTMMAMTGTLGRHGPLIADVGGVARFTGGAHVLLLQQPRIREDRSAIIQRLKMNNIHVQEDFDFPPHLTLGYLEAASTMVVGHVQPVQITFDKVALCCGEFRHIMELK